MPGRFFADNGATITIENMTAPVPEPSTWVLMALGAAGLGFATTHRTRLAYA